MIRSMTGFAAVSRHSDDAHVQVTAKSVNHRFLDLSLRLPHALGAIEGDLRQLIQAHVTRGRLEMSVAVEVSSPPAREVFVDESLIAELNDALAGARGRGLIAGVLTPGDVLRLPQAVEIRTRATDDSREVEPAVGELVRQTVTDALRALVTMRATEGQLLRADLDARLAAIEAMVVTIEHESAGGQSRLEGRLRERVAAMPPDLQGDPTAIAQEIVRLVSRSDIDEELVRLRAHLDHWRQLADGVDPCGRKLDFLVQEMNREVNTIGSKAEGVRAPGVVISAKAELERIKEQVQNVE